MTSPLKIIYSCFLTNSGFTRASLGYIRSLMSLSHDVHINCIHKYPHGDSFTNKELNIIKNTCQLNSMHGDIIIEHCIPHRWRESLTGQKRLCVAVAENEIIDPIWIERMNNRTHSIIYPGSWNKEIFEKSGVTRPGFVIPHFLDEDLWKDDNNDIKFFNKFSFCVIATWRDRKNWPLAFASFEKLADNYDFIVGIKTDKPQVLSDYVIKNHPTIFNRIVIEETELDDQGMVNFMKKFDCIANFSFGEAFCLPLLQGLFLGKPIVTTDIDGIRDYVNNDYASLIKSNGTISKDKMDHYRQFRDRIWPYFDVEESCRALSEIIEKYNSFKSNIQKDRYRLLERFGLISSNKNAYWDPVLKL